MSVNAVSMRSCVLPINLFIIHDGGTNCFASVPGIRNALTAIYKKGGVSSVWKIVDKQHGVLNYETVNRCYPLRLLCRRQQRGQALVFVTVTILIMVLATLIMYSMGQLTTHKQRLQNTVDAAAYSAALAQARDYNFSAYMNRAMIANDVAVAQLVAFRSWSENYNETFKSNNGLTKKGEPGAAGYVGTVKGWTLYPAWTGQVAIARGVGSATQAASKQGFDNLIPILQTMNTGFATTQKVYHFATALTVAQILGVDSKFNAYMTGLVGFDLSLITDLITFGDTPNAYNVIKRNDDHAALSLLGFASYFKDMSNWLKFTEDRNPIGPWGVDNINDWYQPPRYCNYPNQERGGFSISGYGGCVACNRHCVDWGPAGETCTTWCNEFNNNAWTYPPEQGQKHSPRDCPDDGVSRSFCGPQMKKGTFDGPSKDRWASTVVSSLDTFTTDRNQGWNLPILVDPILLIGNAAVTPHGWFMKMLFHESTGVELWNDQRIDQYAGTGRNARGADQVGIAGQTGYKTTGSWNNRWKAHDGTTFFGLATVPVCGIPFWGCINVPSVPFKNGLPAPFGYDKAEADVSLGKTGDGKSHPIHKDGEIFRSYRDVKDVEQGTDAAHQNWTSPPLLVEIERPTGTIKTDETRAYGVYAGCAFTGIPLKRGAPVTAVAGQGNFKVGDGSSANCMRAMAKAEAYFSRPVDLWPRADGKTEYGSLYSPYWQARLIKTTTTDQALSLVIHYCGGKLGVIACATSLAADFGSLAGDAVQGIIASLGQ